MQILKVKTNDKGKELLRFFVIGVGTTIIDFIFYSLTSYLLRNSGFNIAIWVTVISSIAGFLTGTLFNYFFSYLWVYQNFDKTKYKEHQKTRILMFFVLSMIGMLIGVAIMTIFKVSYFYGLNIDIDTWSNVDIPPDLAIFPKIGFFIKTCLCSPTFWLFASAFCSKTIVTLIFNYYSRKKFLFVEQKITDEVNNKN